MALRPGAVPGGAAGKWFGLVFHFAKGGFPMGKEN
jgi:hypothetical protein